MKSMHCATLCKLKEITITFIIWCVKDGRTVRKTKKSKWIYILFQRNVSVRLFLQAAISYSGLGWLGLGERGEVKDV